MGLAAICAERLQVSSALRVIASREFRRNMVALLAGSPAIAGRDLRRPDFPGGHRCSMD
jgi:hypothetical protein